MRSGGGTPSVATQEDLAMVFSSVRQKLNQVGDLLLSDSLHDVDTVLLVGFEVINRTFAAVLRTHHLPASWRWSFTVLPEHTV